MAVIRAQTITNPSTTQSLKSAYALDGNDLMLKTIKRPLSAGDVGTGAGQTRHENGALVVMFLGAKIEKVEYFSVFRKKDARRYSLLNNLVAKSGKDFTFCLVDWYISENKDAFYIVDVGDYNLKADDVIHVAFTLSGRNKK